MQRGIMTNIRLTMEYDGTNYKGWQRQEGKPTIQGSLEYALKKVTKKEITTFGASRTDAGVHALCQTVTFDNDTIIPPKNLHIALNDILPRDIKKMKAAAKFLLGRHDYRPFSCDEERENTLRTVDKIKIFKIKDMVFIDVTAKSFLRRQVRMMAGFLVQAGGSRVKPEIAKEIFNKTTGIKPLVAPASGLCLTKIKY